MEELSVEQKAKAYDKVIERANSLLSGNQLGNAWIYKLLPELKESEDEKIIKSFIRLLKAFHDVNFPTPEGFERKDMIAWLEKQGEHSNFLNKIQIGDKVTRNKDGFLVNLSQLNRVAKPTNKEQKDILEDAILDDNENGLIAETIRYKKEKQGEQKSEEEVDNLHNYLYGKQKLSNNQFTPKQAGVFDKHIDKFLEQKLAWSKEDESLYDYLFGELNASLKDYCGAALKDMKKAIEWLKSLKERIQSQNK